MGKLLTLAAAVLTVTSSLAVIEPAVARDGRNGNWNGQHRGYANNYPRHHGGKYYNQRHYGGRYNNGYRYGYGYNNNNNGAAVAAGILGGVVAGALIGGAVRSNDRDASCAARYRSYDPRSGTYLSYDGNRYPC